VQRRTGATENGAIRLAPCPECARAGCPVYLRQILRDRVFQMVRPHAAQSSRRSAAQTAGQAKPLKSWRRAAAVALFVVLALVTLQVAGLGISGLYAHMAQVETEQLSAAAAPSGAREVGRIEQHLYSSYRYASGNPWTLEQMGALNLAKMRASTVPREAVALTRDARTRFRQLLYQRPTSPFAWANLALAKLYLDEIDDELRAALRYADALGPWEPAVQQLTVFVGLAVWRDLDPGMRQALVRTLERGALRNAEKMAQIVKSYRRFDLICANSKYNSIVGRECSIKH
jgi:hypothetical protein